MTFKNEYTIIVDLKRKIATTTTPTYVQNDTSVLYVKVQNDGQPYNFTNADKYVFTFRRNDGGVVSGEGVLENGVIKYELGSTEMMRVGILTASIQLYLGESRISTMPFNINILKDYEADLVSTKEHTLLQKIFIEVEEKKELIDKAVDDIAKLNEDMNSAENSRQQEHTERLQRVDELIDNTSFNDSYDSTITYHKNNVVSYNGSSFMAKQTTTGNPPPNPLESTENEYWGLVGRKGADGEGTVTTHRDVFVATEGQELFELTYTYDQYQNRTTVYVGGVPQKTPANYEEINNKHIRIPGGVPSGVEVIVEYFSESIPLQSDIQTTVNNHSTELNKLTRQTLHVEEFIAAEDQKAFTLSREYEPMQDKVRVIVDGVEQDSGDNFIESSSTSITLSEGVPAGTEVKVEYYTRTIPIATDVETQLNSHASTLAEHTAFKQETENEIGTEDLQTSNKTIKGAINEVFQSGNNVKQAMVDKLLSIDPSLPINHDSTWLEIEDAIGLLK